jgi:hypothetical protein
MQNTLINPSNTVTANNFHWRCKHTWRRSAKNTAWCLFGCAIGDFATILAFQVYAPDTNPMLVMSLAIVNGLLTSIALETGLLARQMDLSSAFKTAIGMSFVSMVAMEVAMNLTDYLLVGGARLVWWSIIPMLIAGFVTPWPYNYWRLKRYNQACH